MKKEGNQEVETQELMWKRADCILKCALGLQN